MNSVTGRFVGVSFQKKPRTSKRGDTLIEVMFAVAVFGMVSVGAIGIMNRGLYGAQESLEVTMARSEIDTQAEALRFIHEAYVSNPKDQNNPYSILWKKIVSKAYSPSLGGGGGNTLPANFYSSYSDEDNYSSRSCTAIYNGDTKSIPDNAFVINPRLLGTKDVNDTLVSDPNLLNILVSPRTGGRLEETPTYPRILFSRDEESQTLSDVDTTGGSSNINRLYENSRFESAQGIWVTAVASNVLRPCKESGGTCPDFYDFYIRTCWNAPDGKAISNTISSTIRLFNPD